SQGAKMGFVTIGVDVLGGDGESSGEIGSFGKLAGVKVGRDLTGGKGDSSGAIIADVKLGAVEIGHDFTGGGIDNSTSDSGEIWCTGGSVKSVTIHGSCLTGGTVNFSGAILANGTLGHSRTGGSVRGTPRISFLFLGVGD